MSLPRPSGLKAPGGSKLARPSTGGPPKSGLMQPGSISRTQSAIAKSARAAGLSSVVAEKYAADLAQTQRGEEELSTPPPPLDDFIIGDRVFVSGSKPGYIAFLGETQFAPGEWAGVVLDETIGKNDGSVNGVKYFQCEPKRGVFCRISKLSRTPSITAGVKSDDGLSEASMPMNGSITNTPASKRPTTPSGIQRPTTPSHHAGIPRSTTPSLSRPVNKSLSSSSTSLNKGAAPTKVKSDQQTSMSTSTSGVKHNLHVGDRVLVSGSKPGTLRYIGAADFAKGEWAGVELDDPLGKNDGAVAGKRYFECQPRYGLFAPVHKVTKITGGTTPSPMTRSLGSMRLSREKSGSQESVSSMSSATSSASRPRPTPGRAGQRPSTLNISATTSALQKALKEKEEHIEQLLRERDLERSEVARAAAQVDEYQEQLSNMKVEKDRFQEETDENLQQLRARVNKLQEEKNGLELRLEDEKRKVEDLQFQIEEEVISKDDLESRTEEEEAKIRDLEKLLKREKEKSDKYEKDVAALKTQLEHHKQQEKSTEETLTTYLDQVEELTHKLSQAEARIQAQDSSRLEEGAKTSQVGIELAEKTARVTELEDFLSAKEKEIKQLQDRLAEVNDDLESRNVKQDRLQQQLTELADKLKANEVLSNDLSTQLQNLKLENGDLQRQLSSSQIKNAEIADEKTQLEKQVTEMMKNSGDSTNQLQMLNDQLSQKNRKLEEVQADLSTSTQKWHNLNNTLESSMREKEREIETLNNQHKEAESKLNGILEDVQRELEKTKAKTVTMESDFTSEKEALLSRKDGEINEIKQQLKAVREDLEKQEIQTQAHKQVLDKINMEKEAVEFEKEKMEKQVKRLEGERDGLNNELVQLKVSVTKTQVDMDQTAKQKMEMEEKLQDLTEEKLKLEKSNMEIQKQKDEIQSDKDKILTDRDEFKRELMEIKASLQQKDMQVEEFQKDVERLKSENSQQQEAIQQLTQQGSESTILQEQLAEQRLQVESLQKQISAAEAQTRLVEESSKQMEEANRTVKIELEEAQETVTLLEENVKELETERDKLKDEIQKTSETSTLVTELQSERDSLKSQLQTSLDKLKESSEASELVTELQIERDSLKSQLETSLEARQEQGRLMELNKTLNSEIEALHQRYRKEQEKLQSTRDGLQTELDNSGALIEQKEHDIKDKLMKISNLENENSTLKTYKVEKDRLETETQELRDKINKLQSKLLESETKAHVINNVESTNNNTDVNDEMMQKLKEERETAQHQVDFLNSVIVDLQHKNDELKTRLEAMEAGVQNGQDDSLNETPKRRMAPRLFCDICEIFDRHDTEDCPLQEMSDSPPPSQFHGDRKQVRPYCDICEEFHEACSGLSMKKVEESASAKPIDTKDLVKNWVKTVDTVKTELENESKIFGDDQEFFHVQRDPSDVPGFRDSGYYDGIIDSKTSLDTKPGLAALNKSMNTMINEKKSELDTNNISANKSDKGDTDMKYAVDPSIKDTFNRHDFENIKDKRPALLSEIKNLQEIVKDESTKVEAPSSVGPGNSSSDSEYQSGKEDLSLNLDSPMTPDTDIMESSVDTGDVFKSDSPVDENTDEDKAAENCTVS